MSRYYNSFSWSTIGLVVCLALSMLFPLGIEMKNEIQQDYNLPIYISKDISITGFDKYTIKGELSNNTNKDIIIDELQISLSGADGNTHYYAYETIINITVQAYSKYQINLTDKVYYDKQDGSMTINKLNYAHIGKCVINGKTVQLKKQEGDYYVAEGVNSKGYIFLLIIGGVAAISSILIIIYKIKNRQK